MQQDFFAKIVDYRRSVRVYDAQAEIDEQIIQKSLELATLSPNSSNMQLWEFVWVSSPDKKEAIAKACFNQSAARTAPHLIIFLTRQDRWKNMAQWNLDNLKKQFQGKELSGRDKRAMDYYGKLMPLFYRNDWFGFMTLLRKLIVLVKGFNRPFLRVSSHADQRVMVHKSCALAAQTFMLSMASYEYDTCPMEGFDSRLVKKLIGAPAGAEVCMIVACGKGTEDGVYAARTRVPSEQVIRKI